MRSRNPLCNNVGVQLTEIIGSHQQKSTYHSSIINFIPHPSIYLQYHTCILYHTISYYIISYSHSATASFNHPPSLPNPKVKLLGYVFPTLDALRLACTGNSMGHYITLGCVMGSNYIRLN